jgi:long-chain acyl-CoA synthetase
MVVEFDASRIVVPLGVAPALRAHALVDNMVEILEHSEARKYDLRSIQRSVVSSFVNKLNVDSAWRMTETHTADTFTIGMQDDGIDLKSKSIFIDLPMPGNEFKSIDCETGKLKPLGEEREIVVRSPSKRRASA